MYIYRCVCVCVCVCKTLGLKCTSSYSLSNTHKRTHKFIHTKTHKHKNAQTQKLHELTKKLANTSTHKYINSQIHQLTNSQTHQHTPVGAQAHQGWHGPHSSSESCSQRDESRAKEQGTSLNIIPGKIFTYIYKYLPFYIYTYLYF